MSHYDLIVIDHVCREPTLMPPTLYVCPNEIVTYTCYDRQIVAMYWIAEPYISRPQQEPDYNMDNNPLYITRKKPTIKKKEPLIYETVS